MIEFVRSMFYVGDDPLNAVFAAYYLGFCFCWFSGCAGDAIFFAVDKIKLKLKKGN